MTTHYICQNSMTGAIHVLPDYYGMPPKLTPCGYYVVKRERNTWINLKKKNVKVCMKCHKSLLKSHNKNLIAHISYLKLKGDLYGRAKI